MDKSPNGHFWSTFNVNWGQIMTRYDFLWARLSDSEQCSN